MPIHPPKGFALISVLIFLHIFSMLALFGLSSAALALKNTHHAWLHDKNLRLAKQILTELETEATQHLPACVISSLSTTKFIAKSKTWWQLTGCQGEQEGMRYFYVLESLGPDACAVIPGTKFQADYYRITILCYPANFVGTKIMLQATLIRPKILRSHCTALAHPVKIGEQMQRQLR
jgi:hypothetical protein